MGLCEQVEDGEIVEDASEPAKEVADKDGGVDEGAGNSTPTLSERKPSNWSRRDNNQGPSRMVKFFPLSPFLSLVGFSAICIVYSGWCRLFFSGFELCNGFE